MLTRPATHAGSWYSADQATLTRQLAAFFSKAPAQEDGARVLLGPHAGYTYCGQRLAEAYKVWDTRGAERVFILGPSHHVYFKDEVRLSPHAFYDTPLGKVEVDVDVCAQLVNSMELVDGLRSSKSPFGYMNHTADEDEHLFEMHLPFLVHRCHSDNIAIPQIVPIMISGLSVKTRNAVVSALLPYFKDKRNTFIILSDFCHWGRRFGYTEYVSDMQLALLTTYKSATDKKTPIYKSIEYLDRTAMLIASAGLVAKWDAYIESTGNTICGQKPIAVILLLLERFLESGGETVSDDVFQWVGYSQSSKATAASDSSVSYAAGYVLLK